MKKHKPRELTPAKASNSSAEVFVLPPELLAKLGIKLVNVQQPEITPTTPQPSSSQVTETEQSTDHSTSNHLPEREDASSIIETANLMKASVFLSPTFQTSSAAVPYVSPIANGDTMIDVNNSSDCNSLPYQGSNTNEFISEENLNSQKITSASASDISSVTPTTEQVIVVSTDMPYLNTAPTAKPAAKVPVDDHADEAYLSDFSNSHSGCSPDSIMSVISKQRLHANKFIHDAVDDTVQDMDVVSLPSEVVTQPVIIDSENTKNQDSIDKVISEQVTDKITVVNRIEADQKTEIKSDSNKNTINKNKQSKKPVAGRKRNSKSMKDFDKIPESDTYSTENVNDMRQSRIPNIQTNLQENVSSTTLHFTSVAPINVNSCEKSNKTSKKDTPDVKTKNSTEDKVKEIAAYLSQIAQEKNNKIRRRSNNKDTDIKEGPIVSKLCTQGVEKPGGEEMQKENLEVMKVSKTYHKPTRNKIHQVIVKPDTITISDAFQLNEKNTDVKNTKVTSIKHPNEFCICFDFGNLTYYDCEVLYEHIHFWLHNNIECDSETIYSIYDEDNILKQHVNFVKDGLANERSKIDTAQSTLCWNEINILEEDDNDVKKSSIANDAKLSIMRNATSTRQTDNDKEIISAKIPESSINAKHALKHLNKSIQLEAKKIAKNIVEICSEDTKTIINKHITNVPQELNKTAVDDKLAQTPQKSSNKSVQLEAKKIAKDIVEICSKETKTIINKHYTNVPQKLNKTAVDDKLAQTPQKSSNKSVQLEAEKIAKDIVEICSKETKTIINKHITNVPQKLNKTAVDDKLAQTPQKSSNKSVQLEAKKIAKDIVEICSKETKKIINKSITDLPTKLTKSAIDDSSKSQTSFKRKSSINSSAVNESITNKKDNLLPAINSKNSIKDVQELSATYTIDTPRTTRANRSKSSKLNSTDKYDVKLETKKNYERKPIQNTDFAQVSEDKKEASKVMSSTPISSKSEKKLKVNKSSKRPSNTTTADTLAKKAKVHSDSDDDVALSHIKSTKKKRSRNSTQKINQTHSMSEAGTSNIKLVNSTIQDSSVATIDSVITDGHIEFENPIISDSSTNESQLTQLDDSTMFDSTTVDTTFDDTQPIECSTPLAEVSRKLIKCGVCEACMDTQSQWDNHMWKEHNYLAWREGATPLDLENEDQLRFHIQAISNKNGGLECSKCNLKRKHAKPFLRHILACTQSGGDVTGQDNNTSKILVNKSPFICGVCNESVEQSNWIEHIRVSHNYLAWTTAETPVNVDDETEVKEHLNHISKYYGGLICNTCGYKWLYVKKYLSHTCKTEEPKKEVQPLDLPKVVTCGVCKLDVKGRDWVKHIQVAHEYMAWIVGEPPLDVENLEQVKAHLEVILHSAGELICTRCNARRGSTHTYLQHHNACIITGFDMNVAMNVPDTPIPKDHFLCAVCHEVGPMKKWKAHAMDKHYNIAWKVGEVPINLRNPYAVEKYLKIYKRYRGGLVCLQCNEGRSSCYGFYAHVLTCGRTPEEIDCVMNLCEICNNKYLCIYRNQHMAAHRDSDMRREKREFKAKKAEEDALNPPPKDVVPQPMGKRRAAEKAKKVIKKHSSNLVDGKPVCGCGSVFQNAEELEAHSCTKKFQDGNDSDESVKMSDEAISDDDDYALVDSGLSAEEDDELPRKRKRHKPSDCKVSRLQYKIENCSSYLAEAYKDFVETHYTGESLFNIWRNSDYVVIPAKEKQKYLPELIESCKIMFGKDEVAWTTYMRFDARKTAFSLFTGGATSCISWAPPNKNHESLDLYLAVAPHRGPDVPRHGAGETPVHPGVLQIWNFGVFNIVPYCALCIAHEYGIVWAMDWCPSGGRDGPPPEVTQETCADATPSRLGLLAIACSNGSVYILAVPVPPVPSEDEEGPPMYKLNPVAELKLTMASDRRVYQATSVKWSHQKGHAIILVGYSDGTSALFDLNTESPVLAATESGRVVYYPFQDRRAENTAVTSVGLLATTNEYCAVGGQFSTSMTGATLTGRVARPAVRSHFAIGAAAVEPSWPAISLAGDVPFMRSSSELEWWGGGRRLGAARSWAACARCARAASAAQPAVKLHQHHPAHPEIKKLIGAMLVMVPLNKKVKHKENDDLTLVVEPLTYDDAAAKYGLHFYTVPKKRGDQTNAQQICATDDFQAARFPLSDIVAMAFCPSSRYHDRLAVATHTGFVFIINA